MGSGGKRRSVSSCRSGGFLVVRSRLIWRRHSSGRRFLTLEPAVSLVGRNDVNVAAMFLFL
ncbi:MAG: hypothetical protein MJE68_13290, partial [Proteobacteria bacterium]|nr:hypothetical protein [Pseudomonadota bacterium]